MERTTNPNLPAAAVAAQHAEADETNRLIAQANAATAQWPQYQGHFDGYRLAYAKRDVKLRGVLILAKGDAVIYDPASVKIETESFSASVNGKTFATYFCPKAHSGYGCDVSLRTDWFDVRPYWLDAR